MAEVVGSTAPPFSRSVMAAVVTLWELTTADEEERGTCHSTCAAGAVKSGGTTPQPGEERGVEGRWAAGSFGEGDVEETAQTGAKKGGVQGIAASSRAD